MRVVFRLDGVEHLGEAREISTCGAFVVCDQQDLPEQLELHLGSESNPLTVSGDVVRVTPDGFAVAFEALMPDDVVQLDQLLNPGDDQPDNQAASQKEPAAGTIQVKTSDWTPPVSEPTLHQWKPESDLVPPPPGKRQSSGWEGLPTISPQVTIEAPRPIQPEAAPQPAPPPAATATPSRPSSAGEPEPAPAPTAIPSSPSSAGAPEPAPAPTAIPSSPSSAGAPEPAPPLAATPSSPSSAGAEEHKPPPAATPSRPSSAGAEEQADGINRRRYERYDQSIPVVFDTLTSLIKEFTHNISFGGFFVYTTNPMKKGEDIAVTLVHPVHEERLTLLAKVAHAGSAPTPDPVSGEERFGIGVEFRLPLPELKRLLSDFISSHQKQKEAGEATRVMQEARAILNRGAVSQHELLGVDTEAPMETIRRSYFQLVDRFHPDRFFDKVTKSDRKLLEDLFRKLTKAYEELTT